MATARSIMSSSLCPWVATMTIDRSLARPAVKSWGLQRSVHQPSALDIRASECVIGEVPTITRCGTGSTASI